MATVGYVSSLDPNSPDAGSHPAKRRYRAFEYQYGTSRVQVSARQQRLDKARFQDLGKGRANAKRRGPAPAPKHSQQ